MAASPFPTTIAPRWSALCLDRLRYLLDLAPDDVPLHLAPAEVFALVEWARIAMFAECHVTGQGAEALALLKAATAAQLDALADRGAF